MRKQATAALVMAAGVGLGLAGLGAASPAAAASTDTQLCSPDANGATLQNGVCVLAPLHLGQDDQRVFINSAGSFDVWTIESGSIPPGMTLPSTFGAGATILGGTPTQEGTFTFTLDNSGQSQLTYSVTVGPPIPLTVSLPGSGSNLPGGTAGTPYAMDFFINGGVAPYTWSVASGQLPPGLSLVTTDAPSDINNQLAGTPTTAGTFTFTMQVTDSQGAQASQQFTLTVS